MNEGIESERSILARREWRENWTVVLAAALGMGLLSLPTYSMGVFLVSIESEFGWSRAAITSGKLFGGVASIVAGPIIGMIVDRSGARRLALVGSALICAMFAGLSLIGPDIAVWWAIWGGIALAGMLIKPTIWTAGVSSLFSAGRGLALAFTLAGTAFASIGTPLLGNLLIEQFGWRIAYASLAGIWAAIALPVIFICFDSAQDRHRKSKSAAVETPLSLPGVSPRQGLLSGRFARLAMASFLTTLITASFVTTMIPIAASLGHSAGTSAAIASGMGISTVVGRLASGLLCDRMNANYIAGSALTMPIGACVLLLFFSHSVVGVTGAAILLGLTLGAKLHVVAYLTTKHFGMRSYGLLFGTIAGLFGLATGIGPILLNYSYDVIGDYHLGILAVAPIAVVAATLFITLGRYTDFATIDAPLR